MCQWLLLHLIILLKSVPIVGKKLRKLCPLVPINVLIVGMLTAEIRMPPLIFYSTTPTYFVEVGDCRTNGNLNRWIPHWVSVWHRHPDTTLVRIKSKAFCRAVVRQDILTEMAGRDYISTSLNVNTFTREDYLHATSTSSIKIRQALNANKTQPR